MKTIKIITIILLIAIICSASFIGIYKKEEYRVSNIVKDYTLGMEFTDSRVINLEVNKEENAEEKLTVENYKLAKTIIKNRLKKLGVDQYKLTLDENTGNIQLKISDNKETDSMIDNLLQTGTFELKDSETKEVLMGTDTIKNAVVTYSEQETQIAIFLQISFNKESKQKLQEIISNYPEKDSTTTEENESEENSETKSIELYLSGEFITEIKPEQSIMNDMLYIGVGAGTDSKALEQYRKVAQNIAVILNSGVFPITYTETNVVESSKITGEQIKIGMYAALGIIAAMTITFVIGLRTKGILASILQIGYIALLLLTLRYTNVKITFEGIAGIILASIINFVYIYKAFRNIDLDFIKNVTAKFALKLIPIYVIAIVLCFNKSANIYSIGMTLFWGIIVMYLYNLTLTKTTLKIIKK